jgi:hypothetical protein
MSNYTSVPNPKTGNYYYYESDQDENNDPVYTKAKLIDIHYVRDGPMSSKKVYVFDNNVEKDVFDIYSLKSGGKSRRRKLRKSKKRRTSRRIF